MGFLIRSAFWLSLVLLFIPLGAGGETPQSGTVHPLAVVSAAGSALQDVLGLCERQPAVCTTAKAAMHTIAVRAREGVRMARDMMEDQAPADRPAEEDFSVTPAG
ncbi:DUF5330 domain-containing protein [Chelativorans intermedius]|uniref:DUF5330 domain-containing protein n=1 Tax=Chelativorans intermedius TaxID=515947 RepID=A0ABV6DD34_9HYPH|nr:DUF5330 domain-containing protein [Chelativorans intermedius]MCT8999611.1 DUF5330 domain-containing protein [Chelativorans intermedius]